VCFSFIEIGCVAVPRSSSIYGTAPAVTDNPRLRQVVVFSRNQGLRRALHAEWEALSFFGRERLVTADLLGQEDRTLRGWGWAAGHWIRPVTRIIRNLL
jgi:hypothetical protein